VTLSIATQGLLARGRAPALAIAIQGLLVIAGAEANHVVVPNAAVREVTVAALGGPAETTEAGRLVTVSAVSRDTVVQAVIRSVVAEPAEREA
jgi:hypothetical protein